MVSEGGGGLADVLLGVMGGCISLPCFSQTHVGDAGGGPTRLTCAPFPHHGVSKCHPSKPLPSRNPSGAPTGICSPARVPTSFTKQVHCLPGGRAAAGSVRRPSPPVLAAPSLTPDTRQVPCQHLPGGRTFCSVSSPDLGRRYRSQSASSAGDNHVRVPCCVVWPAASRPDWIVCTPASCIGTGTDTGKKEYQVSTSRGCPEENQPSPWAAHRTQGLHPKPFYIQYMACIYLNAEPRTPQE